MPLDGLAALRTALTPLPVPWGVGPALRAALAAGLVLGAALLVADLSAGGIAYLGVACAVAFVGRGDYRSRVANIAGQASGAAVGMTVGALIPDTAPWVIGAAVVVGVFAGMVGRIGPASTGGAVMAVIGVAYTQFGRLAMPWWEPVPAYLLGSAVLLALSLVGAMWHRERYRRPAVSAVFEAAADLVAAAPGAEAEQARHRLALASAAARQAVAGYRLRPAAGPLHAAWSAARERPPPPPSAPSHRRSPGAALPPRRNRPRTVAAWRRGPPRPASSQPRTGRPRRGLPDQSRVFAAGVAALARQLGGSDPDETYRVAHDWRAELERG